MSKVLRGTIRLAGFVVIVVLALLDFLLLVKCAGKATHPLERARWLRRWSRRTLSWLGVRATHRGTPPTTGLLVSNHQSYLDILVFSAIEPMIFVAKSDVLTWPVVGWLTRCAGTLFIRRERRSDVARLNRDMEKIVDAGVLVAVFPEGTSSDGSTVLPFHSSLFSPAEEHRWTCAGAHISYRVEDGSAGREVCYWGDMTFASHLLNLLSKKRIDAEVRFTVPFQPGPSRKELAKLLRQRILDLSDDREMVETGDSLPGSSR